VQRKCVGACTVKISWKRAGISRQWRGLVLGDRTKSYHVMALFVYQPDKSSRGGGEDVGERVILCMCDSGSSVHRTQQSDSKFRELGG
jgi:hypothetical protein